MSNITVIKRDGREEEFDVNKISNSIMEAALAVGGDDYELADDLAYELLEILELSQLEEIKASQLSDLVEKLLIEKGHAQTSKQYILWAADRDRVREMDGQLMRTYEELTFKSAEESATKRENANIDSETAMGTMLKYGSEGAKRFNLLYMVSPDIAEAHKNGDIHIHDLDFLTLTATCSQIDLEKLFEGGFNTGHGFLRTPGGIRSYGALAAIAIQSNQNDQHGGQSIPAFDHYMAPGVAKTFIKEIIRLVSDTCTIEGLETKWEEELKEILNEYRASHRLIMNEEGIKFIKTVLKRYIGDEVKIDRIIQVATKHTDKETYQAMEAFIHNLNSMHSRAGAQVPFSSVNLGTDTSEEGRMVIKNFLLSTEAGLGNGETPIFPISIFKMKKGINVDEHDPNYDLWELACRVSAKRLFPNFSSLDSEYNKAIYKEGDIDTEIAYMGCRTRVATNVYDPTKQVVTGRGNLSFTSVNLPRLGILAKRDIDRFFLLLKDRMELIRSQLLERLNIQGQKKVLNYPFLMGQGVWLDSDKLYATDTIEEVLKHGTLTIGFIGLAECLIALTGEHHGESDEAQELGISIIKFMRNLTDEWSKEERLNYSIIATPAEGLSGRFIELDKRRFGIIQGITDKDYYTNSFHIPVYYQIGALQKIRKEAPYHALCNAGHITYIELDGDPTNNLEAFKLVVKAAYDEGLGYWAINHPVDRDPICGYVGIIGDVCPRCGREEGKPMSEEMWEKVNKYANAHNASTCGSCGDADEEADRVPNKI